MRLLCLLLLSAASAFSQPFSFGVRGGVPMTDFLNAANGQTFNFTGQTSSFTASTNRYIVGPTAELRLPFGLGVEVDALYRHFSYNETGINIILNSVTSSTDTTSGAWEFPLLLKYRFPMKIARPYLDAGVAWDRLSGLTQAVTSTVASITSKSSTSNPAELKNDTSRGFVIGVGLDIKALVIHVSPEFRYTRWGTQHFFLDPTGFLHSNLNQAEFLVGITF
jgi:opacity protein-like surface antigen